MFAKIRPPIGIRISIPPQQQQCCPFVRADLLSLRLTPQCIRWCGAESRRDGTSSGNEDVINEGLSSLSLLSVSCVYPRMDLLFRLCLIEAKFLAFENPAETAALSYSSLSLSRHYYHGSAYP